MQMKRLLVAATAIATLALASPSGAAADHIGIGGGVSATVERYGEDSWLVTVIFTVSCRGTGAAGASYQGNLYLVEHETGEETYMGGVFGPSGDVGQLVHSTHRWQGLAPVLRISCFDNKTLHGSGNVEMRGGVVFIPPRMGGGGSRGGGGGGGGSGGSGDPTEPLRTEGCKELLIGTARADDLRGGPVGEVIFGLAKGDRIRGGDRHDCLLGGSGPDELRGEDGWDRLTGGTGRDRLFGGEGLNSYDGGRGRDFIHSANGRREPVRCGPGRDRVKADPSDDLFGCEVVSRIRPQGS